MAKSLYYRIGQACKELDIQPYVLRYWETEFSVLSPDKSKSGQRVYSEQDLQIIRRIKELLYDEGFTIAGAKKRLDAELQSGDGVKPRKVEPDETGPVGESAAEEAPAVLDTGMVEQIETLRLGLEEALTQSREILDMLDAKPAGKGGKK